MYSARYENKCSITPKGPVKQGQNTSSSSPSKHIFGIYKVIFGPYKKIIGRCVELWWIQVHHIKAAGFRLQPTSWQEGQYHGRTAAGAGQAWKGGEFLGNSIVLEILGLKTSNLLGVRNFVLCYKSRT